MPRLPHVAVCCSGVDAALTVRSVTPNHHPNTPNAPTEIEAFEQLRQRGL